jgi:YD repeat-containing protein
MNARMVMMFLAAAVFLSPFSMPLVHAQSISCIAPFYCSWYSFDSGCVPRPPENAFNCQYNGPWAQVCSYMTTSCAPPPCSCGAKAGQGGGPISFATGNTYISASDLKVPGLSRGLELTRTWNSIWAPRDPLTFLGLFGPNWKSTYEERVYVGSDNYLKYMRGDGDVWSFAYAGGTYAQVSPANTLAAMALDSGITTWTVRFQNGEYRTFNYLTGLLTSIVDRNGNITQLTYDSSNRLVTVADPGGRHLYFGYANNSSYLVTSVTSDVGISLSYSYDSSGRLIQVTNPDSTTVSYVYDSTSMITSVKDSNGTTLESHTYDSCGRGLSSSRAGGVETLTLSYDQPCWSAAPARYQYFGY